MRTTILALLGFLSCTTLSAQSFWHFAPENELNVPKQAARPIQPKAFRTLDLDVDAVRALLATAPMEYTPGASPLALELPAADGKIRKFQVWESPVMEPGLIAKYPEIRTYAGHSADGCSVRLGAGSQEFYAFMWAADGGLQTVRPLAEGQKRAYMVYRVKDLPEPDPSSEDAFRCGLDSEEGLDGGRTADFSSKVIDRGDAPIKLKKYRLAISSMTEYTYGVTNNNPTKPKVLAEIVKAVNFINLLYERDFAVHLDLIANNDALIFFDTLGDPFSGNQTVGFRDQNPGAINPIIGLPGYDIGHVFGVYVTGNKATGVAYPAGVCNDLHKAQGCSTAEKNSLISEYFYKVAAHEMCHQFSGSHTWNNCSADYVDQRSLGTVFEPGSGSTLMAYAGGCYDSGTGINNNVQNDNDPYFHLVNILQVRQYVETGGGNTCGTEETTSNNPPVANIPLNDGFYIPISTYFKLTGEGSDPDGDPITFCWEQWDRDTTGIPVNLGMPAAEGALFRSYPPTPDPTRVFPHWPSILASQNNVAEVLPTVSRPLTFRLTVRDNHTGAGSIAWDELKFRAAGEAGPFLVTYPNISTVTWLFGEYQTVVWNVANTNQAPVNCKTVNIRLSTDGGLTFPTLLAAGVPNNGKACVKVPAIATTKARVLVEAADNIFFDLSNSGFKIQAPAQPSFSLCAGLLVDTICLPATYTATITSSALQGFSQPVNLTAAANFPGVVLTLGASTINPGSETTLKLEFPGSHPDGDFQVVVGGSAAGLSDSVVLFLHIVSNDFTALAPVTPLNGAVGQDQSPVLRWVDVADANVYDVQVATNPSFDSGVLVASVENTALDTFRVPVLLGKGQILYWRIRAENECGVSEWFGPYAFSTVIDVCQTFESTDVPKNITANTAATVESKITVPAGGVISDVNITKIQGNHDFFKDLEMRLISPTGTDVQLFVNKCPNTTSFNFGFDDSKLASFNCPPPNNGTTYKPAGLLSANNGQNAGGVWILRVIDSQIGSGGKITGFALELCSSASPNPPVLVNNLVMQVAPGTNKAVTPDLLKTTDANNTDNQLVYTLMTTPKYGELQLNWSGTKLLPGAQFTQADLNNGALAYFDYGFNGKPDKFCFTVTDGEGGLIADCFTIQPFPAVGTHEPGRALDFLLAPNPATDRVRISFGEALASDTRVRLSDASGRLVRNTVLAAGQWAVELDVTGLPQGMYLVSVDNSQGSGVRKVVVR